MYCLTLTFGNHDIIGKEIDPPWQKYRWMKNLQGEAKAMTLQEMHLLIHI